MKTKEAAHSKQTKLFTVVGLELSGPCRRCLGNLHAPSPLCHPKRSITMPPRERQQGTSHCVGQSLPACSRALGRAAPFRHLPTPRLVTGLPREPHSGADTAPPAARFCHDGSTTLVLTCMALRVGLHILLLDIVTAFSGSNSGNDKQQIGLCVVEDCVHSAPQLVKAWATSRACRVAESQSQES